MTAIHTGVEWIMDGKFEKHFNYDSYKYLDI